MGALTCVKTLFRVPRRCVSRHFFVFQDAVSQVVDSLRAKTLCLKSSLNVSVHCVSRHHDHVSGTRSVTKVYLVKVQLPDAYSQYFTDISNSTQTLQTGGNVVSLEGHTQVMSANAHHRHGSHTCPTDMRRDAHVRALPHCPNFPTLPRHTLSPFPPSAHTNARRSNAHRSNARCSNARRSCAITRIVAIFRPAASCRSALSSF